MPRRLLQLAVFVGLLTGCAAWTAPPYTLRHPGSGTTVTCGEWIWWECLLFDYEQHGYQRVRKFPALHPQDAT